MKSPLAVKLIFDPATTAVPVVSETIVIVLVAHGALKLTIGIVSTDWAEPNNTSSKSRSFSCPVHYALCDPHARTSRSGNRVTCKGTSGNGTTYIKHITLKCSR